MTSYLVHLTDTHVNETVGADWAGIVPAEPADGSARLAIAVRSINAEPHPLRAVIATGDLTSDGTDAEFAALGALLEPLTAPVLAVPGNHDERGRFRALFADLPWVDAQHASWTVDLDGITVIGLDTTIPGAPGAEFDADRAAWLDRVLTDADDRGNPTILAMHHPPFASGITWMDRSGFVGLDRFVAILGRHRVDRILCGHMHRPMTALVGGTIAQVGPATVQHVALDLDGPDSTKPSLIHDPVGYMIYRHHRGQWVSHVRYVDTGHEPYRPSWVRG